MRKRNVGAAVAVFFFVGVFWGFASPVPASGALSMERKASYRSKPKGCPKGSFFDPIKGGECWSCSKGYNRTAYAVDSKKACVRPSYERFKHAKKKRKNQRIGQGCPRGQFWDVKGGNGLLGACYTCDGWRRTAYAVDNKKACVTRVSEKLAKATNRGKFACPSGQFFDPRKGGECWSCPGGYIRSVTAVTSKTACVAGPALAVEIAKQIAAEKIAAGLVGPTDALNKQAGGLEKKANDVDKQVSEKTAVVTVIKNKTQNAIKITRDAVKDSKKALDASVQIRNRSITAANLAAKAKTQKCKLCSQKRP